MDIRKTIVGLTCAYCIGLIGCKQAPQKASEQMRPKTEKEKKAELKERLKPEIIRKNVVEILNPHFETIDTIVYDRTPEDIYEYFSGYYNVIKKEYSYDIRIKGTVYGKAKVSSKPPYYFETSAEVVNSKPLKVSDLESNLMIKDDHDQLIYCKGEDLLEANKAYLMQKISRKNSELAKREEEQRIKESRNFVIDGIKIEYAYTDGNSYVYRSEKSLSPEQITLAIKKIGGNSMNMIHFHSANGHYADFVYKTQCIIYISSNSIYKVIDGKPYNM